MFFRNKKDNLSELVGYAGFFLGSEIQAEGTIKTEDDVYVDGGFKGEITTPGAIEVGKNAVLKGSLNARSIILEGNVTADVTAQEEVSVAGCGEIHGKVKALRIQVEPGAVVNATINTTDK